jgi:cold shock CspA family protein
MKKIELKGVIRKWVFNKKFGFIETKDGDYYFKEQDIVSDSSKGIKVRNKVTFEAHISPSNDECD